MKLEDIARKQRPKRVQYASSYDGISERNKARSESTTPSDESATVYFADGSGYVPASGPCGPLYFDRNGNT